MFDKLSLNLEAKIILPQEVLVQNLNRDELSVSSANVTQLHSAGKWITYRSQIFFAHKSGSLVEMAKWLGSTRSAEEMPPQASPA
jgi:hypothetical protein